MKIILRIKWELILAILTGLLTIVSWSVIESLKDFRLMIIAGTNLLVFTSVILGYNSIKEFRIQVLKMWN